MRNLVEPQPLSGTFMWNLVELVEPELLTMEPGLCGTLWNLNF